MSGDGCELCDIVQRVNARRADLHALCLSFTTGSRADALAVAEVYIEGNTKLIDQALADCWTLRVSAQEDAAAIDEVIAGLHGLRERVEALAARWLR